MIQFRRNCKEIEGRSLGVKRNSRAREKPWSARFGSPKEAPAKMALGCEIPKKPVAKSGLGCEKGPWLRNDFAASAKILAAAKPPLSTRVPFYSP